MKRIFIIELDDRAMSTCHSRDLIYTLRSMLAGFRNIIIREKEEMEVPYKVEPQDGKIK